MYDPKTIAVVGAGNMGAGIAQKIAQEGYLVLLADTSLEQAQEGLARIEASLAQAIESGDVLRIEEVIQQADACKLISYGLIYN